MITRFCRITSPGGEEKICGSKKIPELHYVGGHETPRCSRHLIWRSAVDTSRNITQLALQYYAEMLVNMDIPWVIVGHSERRELLGETNEFVGDKIAYALAQGLKVIACIGETLEQRQARSTVNAVAAQTKAIIIAKLNATNVSTVHMFQVW
ncbi:hypothetical protein OROMI_006376 [Orobanche minor]